MAATSVYDQVWDNVRRGVPVAMATIVEGPSLGARMLVLPDATEGELIDEAFSRLIAGEASELLRAEESATRDYSLPDGGTVRVFIETFPPAPLLLIFGAVHVAQAMNRFAKDLGFRVVVSDARRTLATRERFPLADQILIDWPDDTLAKIEVPENTAIVILTHDPKFDEPAIFGSFKTPARYIGSVGSRKTSAERRERLRKQGVSEEDLARLHAPMGLNIGGNSPEEMALSILGEIIATRYGRPGGFLADAKGSIRGKAAAAAT